MKCSKRSFAVVSLLFAVLLSLNIGILHARDADLASRTIAAAQTAKQQCINTCRARYRDCRRLNQVPSFECGGFYQDCTRYTCTGLRPGFPPCLLPPSAATPALDLSILQALVTRRRRGDRVSGPMAACGLRLLLA